QAVSARQEDSREHSEYCEILHHHPSLCAVMAINTCAMVVSQPCLGFMAASFICNWVSTGTLVGVLPSLCPAVPVTYGEDTQDSTSRELAFAASFLPIIWHLGIISAAWGERLWLRSVGLIFQSNCTYTDKEYSYEL